MSTSLKSTADMAPKRSRNRTSAAKAKTTSNGTSPFLSLPLELRKMIYSHCFPDKIFFANYSSTQDLLHEGIQRETWSSPLFQLNHQISGEARTVMFEQTTYVISATSGYLAYLLRRLDGTERLRQGRRADPAITTLLTSLKSFRNIEIILGGVQDFEDGWDARLPKLTDVDQHPCFRLEDLITEDSNRIAPPSITLRVNHFFADRLACWSPLRACGPLRGHPSPNAYEVAEGYLDGMFDSSFDGSIALKKIIWDYHGPMSPCCISQFQRMRAITELMMGGQNIDVVFESDWADCCVHMIDELEAMMDTALDTDDDEADDSE